MQHGKPFSKLQAAINQDHDGVAEARKIAEAQLRFYRQCLDPNFIEEHLTKLYDELARVQKEIEEWKNKQATALEKINRINQHLDELDQTERILKNKSKIEKLQKLMKELHS